MGDKCNYEAVFVPLLPLEMRFFKMHFCFSFEEEQPHSKSVWNLLESSFFTFGFCSWRLFLGKHGLRYFWVHIPACYFRQHLWRWWDLMSRLLQRRCFHGVWCDRLKSFLASQSLEMAFCLTSFTPKCGTCWMFLWEWNEEDRKYFQEEFQTWNGSFERLYSACLMKVDQLSMTTATCV